jgi:hypothetical protein
MEAKMSFQIRPQGSLRRTLLVATCLALAPALVAHAETAKPAPAKAKAYNPRGLDGAWDRYPQFGDSNVDPTVKPPPPAPPPPLKPEYMPDWQAKQKQVADANARGEPPVTNYVKCIPDGMPATMMAMFPLEVMQSKDRVTIIEEAYNQVRRIYLNEQQIQISDAEPGFWGHSVGHWEGNTLLVNTVGIKDYVRYRDVPHSDQMRIDEKISLLDANHMKDVITVTDPVYLTQPWTWTWEYQRRPGYKLYEYVCEDNREYADPDKGSQRLKLLPGSK